jgi:hypothetical protein
MPRRNGKSQPSSPREAVGRAFRELETSAGESRAAQVPATSTQRMLEAVAGRGFWFWVAATLFGLVIGLWMSGRGKHRY